MLISIPKVGIRPGVQYTLLIVIATFNEHLLCRLPHLIFTRAKCHCWSYFQTLSGIERLCNCLNVLLLIQAELGFAPGCLAPGVMVLTTIPYFPYPLPPPPQAGWSQKNRGFLAQHLSLSLYQNLLLVGLPV